jgi:hypothetical protein
MRRNVCGLNMAEKTCEITVGRKRKLAEENARGDNVAEKKN